MLLAHGPHFESFYFKTQERRTTGNPNVLSEPKFLGFCAQERGHNARTVKDKEACSDLDLDPRSLSL